MLFRSDWAEANQSVWNHYFLYVSLSRATYDIKDGKVSPWLVLNCKSGKEMLKTPDSITEFLKETGESMASMAVGGAILAIPSSIHAAVTETGYKGMSNDQFALFESAANNSDLQTAFVTNLKNKVLSGDITTAQAKETLNNYRNSVGLFRELPEGLDMYEKKEAMDLLKEKRNLENKIGRAHV